MLYKETLWNIVHSDTVSFGKIKLACMCKLLNVVVLQGGPSLQSPMICRLADGVSLTGEEGDKSTWRVTMIMLGRWLSSLMQLA